MSIIVSGTTIPTSGDYVKVGSTLIDKVDVVSNAVRTTVWEKQKDFYIWKDGMPYSDYYPTKYEEKVSSGCSYSSTFEKRNGNYGLTVSNIRTDGGRVFDLISCGFKIPDITVSGCKTMEVLCSFYFDNGDGARTWYFKVYGINSAGSETQISSNYGLLTSEKFTLNIQGYSKIRIIPTLNCGMHGETGNHCSGCTVGFYINYILLKQ